MYLLFFFYGFILEFLDGRGLIRIKIRTLVSRKTEIKIQGVQINMGIK